MKAAAIASAGPSDADLVRRVLSGDVECYAVLVARYRDRFGRFATQMLGNREDAEEALQDAFVRGYRALARCEDPERFGSWLFRILVNRCRTHGAKRARREKTIVLDEIALPDLLIVLRVRRKPISPVSRKSVEESPKAGL